MAYDQALEAFIRAVLADPALTGEIARFVDRLDPAWRATSLAQKLVQLTMPGVADTYQGTELWDLSLVDPDNRRPVDYALRRDLLAGLSRTGSATWTQPAGAPDSAGPAAGFPAAGSADVGSTAAGFPAAESAAALGAGKLHVVRTALRLRREHPEWFLAGATYQPLPCSSKALGFLRSDQVAVVVPLRSLWVQSQGWGAGTVGLPEGRWRNLLTGAACAGGELLLADLLADLPVALLARDSA